METIKAARLDGRARLPVRKHPADAGIDFYALEACEVPAGESRRVRTGITMEIPIGFAGILKPKGGSTHLIGSGVIDAGYQGEIIFRVVNPLKTPLAFQPGDPVGQMLLIPVVTPAVTEMDPGEIHAQRSERGATGGILGGG
jgi:dUTP pyrophosphatase